MLRNAAQRHINNANPSGLLEKMFIANRNSAILLVRLKFQCKGKIIVALFL